MPTERRYEWYEAVEGWEPLEQGDFLDAFPVAVFPEGALAVLASAEPDAPVRIGAEVVQFDVLVMTQSCDLPKLADDDEVILCERIAYPAIGKYGPDLATQKGWERLRKGQQVGLHLLGSCTLPGKELPHQVVNLRRVFMSPLGVVRAFVGSRGRRVRLCPPYREHLSQAFARQFMRVGLPVDLPERSPYSGLQASRAE